MADHRSALKFELQELLLVALGAVPGALLRWQFALHLADQNLVANTLGSALLGFVYKVWQPGWSSGFMAVCRKHKCCNSKLQQGL